MYSGHFKHELKNSTINKKCQTKKNMTFWGPPNSPTAHLSDGPLVRQPISPTTYSILLVIFNKELNKCKRHTKSH